MIHISKPFITEAEKQAVMEVLDSGYIVQGPRTASLEEKFAEVCGTDFAIATSSGTTALHLALLANGIGAGDEVITTPFTFMASINTILFVGAKPVFVDIQPDTFNIDPNLIEAAITPATNAILPVHLYGQPCEMDRIMQIAQEYDLAVIEDAAQAVGAAFKGQPVGGFGTGCFSLYATKNIMSAEGGMITTNDPEIAENCRMLRNHGMQRRYHHEILGYNFRMTDVHAAIGLAQINRLDELTTAREKNAAYLNEHITSVVTPAVRPDVRHVWHQYTIRVDGGRDRDAAVATLREAGVGTGIFYPIPAYKQKHLVEMGFGEESHPVTEQMVNQVISLPVHPLLTEEELAVIAEEVNKL